MTEKGTSMSHEHCEHCEHCKTRDGAQWAVWLQDRRVACFAAADYDYEVDDQGELWIMREASASSGAKTEVARFAAGFWQGVVRTDVMQHMIKDTG